MDQRKALTVRMDDDIHKQVKIKAVMENTTVQDYILNLIKNDLAKSPK